MNRVASAVLVVIALTPSTLRSQTVDEARRGIRAMFDSLNAAAARRDRAALERIYAPEFRFVHATGGIVTREEQVNGLVNPAGNAPRLPVPPLDSLRLFGDIALLGREQNGIFANNVWIHRDGRWQILLLQGTMLPQRRAAVAVDPRRFSDYAGRYVLDSLAVTISVEGDSLMVQRAMGPRLAVKPVAPDMFEDRFAAGLTFVRDGSGVVTHFTYKTAAGVERTWTRTKKE